MDVELALWMGVFLGGYAAALAWLLRLMLTRGSEDPTRGSADPTRGSADPTRGSGDAS